MMAILVEWLLPNAGDNQWFPMAVRHQPLPWILALMRSGLRTTNANPMRELLRSSYRSFCKGLKKE